jgi:proteic killer suppression protein
MDIKFDKKYLSELYYEGRCSDKKHRFQPQVIKKYQLCIETLESVSGIESLYKYHSLNYEVLKGDKKGVSSIRVNQHYRIEFTASQVEHKTIVTVCNILELSNHYK